MSERSGASAAHPTDEGSQPMRLVFLGSGAFGLPTFDALARMHSIAMVITQPDRPAGRKKVLMPTPIGAAAQRQLLPILKPENINTPQIIAQVRTAEPHAIVVIAYGQKIGPELRDIAPMINLHGSLLPKYRGAAPINWAVMNGETRAGVTVIDVADRMDAGAMYGSAATAIDPMETAGELHDRLAQLGPELMLQVLDDIQRGAANPQPQDDSQVTKAPKLSKSIGTVSFDQPAEHVRAMVHGLTPWPGCTVLLGVPHPGWTDLIDERRLKLLRVKVIDNAGIGEADVEPGTVLDSEKIVCQQGALQLLSVQPPGGQSMSFEAYCRGHRLQTGCTLRPIATSNEQSS